MEIVGGIILCIVVGAVAAYVVEAVTRNARQHVPAHTRQRVSTTARRATAAPRETVATIFARAYAQNWLEKRQHNRARKAAQPPREPRPRRERRPEGEPGRARQAGRKIWATVTTVARPKSTEHVPPRPGRDPEPATGTRTLRPVPDPQPNGHGRPAQPTASTEPPSTRPGSAPATDNRKDSSHARRHADRPRPDRNPRRSV